MSRSHPSGQPAPFPERFFGAGFDPKFATFDEACAYARICRFTGYQRVADRRWQSFHDSGRHMVVFASVLRSRTDPAPLARRKLKQPKVGLQGSRTVSAGGSVTTVTPVIIPAPPGFTLCMAASGLPGGLDADGRFWAKWRPNLFIEETLIVGFS